MAPLNPETVVFKLVFIVLLALIVAVPWSDTKNWAVLSISIYVDISKLSLTTIVEFLSPYRSVDLGPIFNDVILDNIPPLIVPVPTAPKYASAAPSPTSAFKLVAANPVPKFEAFSE